MTNKIIKHQQNWKIAFILHKQNVFVHFA